MTIGADSNDDQDDDQQAMTTRATTRKLVLLVAVAQATVLTLPKREHHARLRQHQHVLAPDTDAPTSDGTSVGTASLIITLGLCASTPAKFPSSSSSSCPHVSGFRLHR